MNVIEGGKHYSAPKFIIRRQQQQEVEGDTEEHEDALIVPALVDVIVPKEKEKRTVKKYVHRMFAKEIAQAEEDGSNFSTERITRRSTLSSVLLPPPPADDKGKGKKRKRKRKRGRGRRKKGRKNTKPKGKNDKNVDNHLRQAVAKHANYVQAFFLLIGICGKEGVLNALKQGKTFKGDIGTMPWNKAFYDRIFKEYSVRVNTKTPSFLKTWEMDALSSKYASAFATDPGPSPSRISAWLRTT